MSTRHNYVIIPLRAGGEKVSHFILRCLVTRAVFEKNRIHRKWAGQKLVESEKLVFPDKKPRVDVYDPVSKIGYEIQSKHNGRNEEKKKNTYTKSDEIEDIVFIYPEDYFILINKSIMDAELEKVYKKLLSFVIEQDIEHGVKW